MDSLFGITFRNWIKLLFANRFKVSLSQLPLCFMVTILSWRNSLFNIKDNWLNRNNNINFSDPIFILGHWRSGTTFLHNVLINDKNFYYPRIFEIAQPFSFLTIRKHFIKIVESREVKNRPMDNVKNDPLLPGEEEFALAAITLKSPVVGWSFAKRYEHYEKYLTLEDISNSDRELWKSEYYKYLQKISKDNEGKQLLLKSPTNTARIKFLLELFPNAKFINISRHPIDVYKSTMRLHDTALKKANLQGQLKCETKEYIIETYSKMYKSYFDALKMIPEQNFVSVKFEDFEENPIDVLKNIYNTLNINNFDENKEKFVAYLDTLKGYKKNEHKQIDENTRKKIIENWKVYYEKWGYEI